MIINSEKKVDSRLPIYPKRYSHLENSCLIYENLVARFFMCLTCENQIDEALRPTPKTGAITKSQHFRNYFQERAKVFFEYLIIKVTLAATWFNFQSIVLKNA